MIIRHYSKLTLLNSINFVITEDKKHLCDFFVVVLLFLISKHSIEHYVTHRRKSQPISSILPQTLHRGLRRRMLLVNLSDTSDHEKMRIIVIIACNRLNCIVQLASQHTNESTMSYIKVFTAVCHTVNKIFMST